MRIIDISSLHTVAEVDAALDAIRNCPHSRSHVVRRVQRTGGVFYKLQCEDCAETFGNSISHRDVPPDAPDFDEELKARAVQQWEELVQRRNELASIDWWSLYLAYLKTPEWQQKRMKVLARAGGKCEGCADRPATQVHHLTYDHVGDEMLFELVAVCTHCHEKMHPRTPEEREYLKEIIGRAMRRRDGGAF